MLRATQRAQGMKLPTDLIEPANAKKLLKQLLRDGYTQKELQQLTGINSKTLTDLRTGARPKIQRKVESALERVQEESPRYFEPYTNLPAKKSRQILKSLMAQGWSLDHQRAIIEKNRDHPAGFLHNLTRNRTKYIWAINALQMQWLEKMIGDREGPSQTLKTKMYNRAIFPTKHYSLKGDLIVSSLSAEQRAKLKSVQSNHG
jgi:hypothetical protein